MCIYEYQRSLPSRERELKLAGAIHGSYAHASLPSRERELKHVDMVFLVVSLEVAPLAGA